jgi:tetratricopeptide (TPR) repeat protein
MALGFGFNKVKVLASAEKFVQQGKLQNAIAEYEKVAREDPKDLTVLNTIGDLYARIGDNEHAVHYFKKVGDQYAQSGFTVKAIAIYKKLSKLATSNAEHITKLAELYTQQGLFTDARAQYMLMADAHLRAGETNQAARIFQKILELDPENAAMQAKLADLYMKLGKKEDALKIYSSAAEALYARGSMEAAAEALNKVITLDPSNAGGLLLRGMIAADSGDHVCAIQYLELVPDLNSRPDTLRALLRARMESDNIEGADALAQTLLDRHNDPSALSNLAEWYVNHDHVSSAVRLYESNGNKLFGDHNAELQNTLYALINKVKDNPEALDSLQKLLQQRGGDAGTSAEVMELQAHAAAQKGDYAQARDLYKKLSELEPENALHSQNHRQMLVKLGEDSATRILTPEEAAQAFMVEELDENTVVVHQKYDTPTETAIEAALTDAELYVSYNVPSKAIAPLEAALPLAPKDITLNQRLATLYARAERYGDASKICKNLSDIYHELGHTAEAAKYQEASRKYGLRAGVAPSAAAAMRNLAPLPVRAAEAPAQNITASVTPPAAIAPGEDTASSVQEFSFDVAMAAEPETTAAPPEIEILPETPPVPPEFELQAYPVKVQPEPVQEKTPEVAESNEWEDMLSVEVDEPEEAKVELADEVVVEDGTKLEPELIPQAMVEPEPMVVAEKEPEGGSSVCYAVDDKVQEVQFFISQKMWKAANDALNELSEIAPDSARIPELMAAIAAEQSRPAPEEPAQPAASAALEEAAASFLPPPFAAPAPQTNLSAMVDPFAAHIPASHATPAAKAPAVPPPPAPKPAIVHAEEPVLELDEEIATPAAKPARVSPAALEPVASAKSTEDILTDFVHDLESDELKDFLPRPHAERAMPAQVAKAAPQPVAAPVASRAHTNGGAQAEDASSVLADMLSDLQDETAEAAEPQEDPETHYNLGIAFKEMGLLDEAIGELQKVCHAIDSGHTFSQPIQAYTWLAQCLVDKGAPEAAVRWYQKALKIPELDDSSRCAIYYDLAAAYEAFGDRKSALTNFMEVYGSNIDFRDVASRIKTLKS